jgi:anion-transporting  ArsA/GET3 family ATPase
VSAPAGLPELVADRGIIVCVGSGGVGKTTTAAAVGLEAARRGRRVLVLTIDPARRLANALGLPSFGNEVRRIELLDAAPGGELYACMLDTQATFDDLVHRLSPDDSTREAIFGNRIYRVVSDNFAGSQEYMATERLYDVHRSGEYDLIVLDTPPVKNALDFIEAPGRLARFVDRQIVRWFLTPYHEKRVFGRVLVGTSGVVFRLLGMIFGREFLDELSGFFQAFRELMDGFHERHAAVTRLFADPGTAFVVVCAPNEPSVDVASFFHQELRARGLLLEGFVLNQVHRCQDRGVSATEQLGALAASLASDLPAHTAPSLLARLEAAHRRLRSVVAEEHPFVERVNKMAGDGHWVIQVPLLDRPIRDLAGLEALAARLFPGEPARGR